MKWHKTKERWPTRGGLTFVETNFHKFAISKSCGFEITCTRFENLSEVNCKYEFYFLPNRKVTAEEDHGKNYMKDMPPLVCHLLRNGLSHLM